MDFLLKIKINESNLKGGIKMQKAPDFSEAM
jgi:hypothetical protein